MEAPAQEESFIGRMVRRVERELIKASLKRGETRELKKRMREMYSQVVNDRQGGRGVLDRSNYIPQSICADMTMEPRSQSPPLSGGLDDELLGFSTSLGAHSIDPLSLVFSVLPGYDTEGGGLVYQDEKPRSKKNKYQNEDGGGGGSGSGGGQEESVDCTQMYAMQTWGVSASSGGSLPKIVLLRMKDWPGATFFRLVVRTHPSQVQQYEVKDRNRTILQFFNVASWNSHAYMTSTKRPYMLLVSAVGIAFLVKPLDKEKLLKGYSFAKPLRDNALCNTDPEATSTEKQPYPRMSVGGNHRYVHALIADPCAIPNSSSRPVDENSQIDHVSGAKCDWRAGELQYTGGNSDNRHKPKGARFRRPNGSYSDQPWFFCDGVFQADCITPFPVAEKYSERLFVTYPFVFEKPVDHVTF